ncbi:MAG: primosomal protein N' [Thiothrix sp.]
MALVAVPRPLRTLFSYTLQGCEPLVGMRVLVPFGKQHSVGVVSALQTTEVNTGDATFTLKAVEALLDGVPVLDEQLLDLLQWAARYYHHPLGEVIFSALPLVLRKAKPLPKRLQAALSRLASPQPVEAVADTLRLNEAQQACLQQIQQWNQQPVLRPVLLHGITGSGKTEIYLRLLAPLVATGQQALVLVPEIGLTPQLLERFQRFFGAAAIVCLHSGLSEGERLQAWLQARSGQAAIILGTRSAIFAPAPFLGMIIVDEEHDASFKQQEGFRYHARDLAVKRAQMLAIPIVLGSATPALETLYNAQIGRFHYTRLSRRPAASSPPQVRLQDTRPFALEAGLTPPSLQAIRQTLERGEQAMVFLNRRGFAPTLFCPSCGWHARCAHCSANMTWHARRNRLICHHCGAEQAAPLQCPACHSQQLTTQGLGTERLELSLESHFPNFPVIRIDRDSTSRKGELTEKLASVRSNAPLLLVGTQMLAKGHDFPNLTLVVIVDIDHALFSTDYRALERLGQLLVQVAGRAGRAAKAGQVTLQTCQPEHPLLHQLVGHGYRAYAQQLLAERQRWQFPPFAYQALIRASSSSSMEKALRFLAQLNQWLAAHAPQDIRRFGPVPAVLEKRANRYRAQLLLSSPRRAALHSGLHALLHAAPKFAASSGIRWSVDVDPLDFS